MITRLNPWTLLLHIEKVCSIQTCLYTKSETSSLHPICVGDRRADVSVSWFIHRASCRVYWPTPRRVCRSMLSLFCSVPAASAINTLHTLKFQNQDNVDILVRTCIKLSAGRFSGASWWRVVAWERNAPSQVDGHECAAACRYAQIRTC